MPFTPVGSFYCLLRRNLSLTSNFKVKFIVPPVINGGVTVGTGRTSPPPSSRQDQFSNSPKFDEKMLGLG